MTLKKAKFFFIIGIYKDFIIFKAFVLFVPTTTRSGTTKSLIASPSLKNSGFETTSYFVLNLFFFKIFSILSPVVTGAVDLVTITLYLFKLDLIVFETWKTYFKSAALVFLFVGVPTQMNMTSDFLIDSEILFENASLFWLTFYHFL